MGWSSEPKTTANNVLPTESVIAERLVGTSRKIAIQLAPLASGQNLTARVKVTLDDGAVASETSFPDFADPIPAGKSKTAVIDTAGIHKIAIVGEYDGAGGAVDVYTRRDQ